MNLNSILNVVRPFTLSATSKPSPFNTFAYLLNQHALANSPAYNMGPLGAAPQQQPAVNVPLPQPRPTFASVPLPQPKPVSLPVSLYPPNPGPSRPPGYNPAAGDMANPDMLSQDGLQARQVLDPVTGKMLNDYFTNSLFSKVAGGLSGEGGRSPFFGLLGKL